MGELTEMGLLVLSTLFEDGRGETGIWMACTVGILVSEIRFAVSDFKPFG